MLRLPPHHCRRSVLVFAAALLLPPLLGCDPPMRRGIDATFPRFASATPWVLAGDVWSGSFEDARPGLGDEAAQWEAFQPQNVWLAVYRHDTRPENHLTARIWSFAETEDAAAAFEHFRPADADVLEAGDRGCWTDLGILVQWKRLVIEVFASGAPGTANAEQSLYLYALIEKQLNAELAGDPR